MSHCRVPGGGIRRDCVGLGASGCLGACLGPRVHNIPDSCRDAASKLLLLSQEECPDWALESCRKPLQTSSNEHFLASAAATFAVPLVTLSGSRISWMPRAGTEAARHSQAILQVAPPASHLSERGSPLPPGLCSCCCFYTVDRLVGDICCSAQSHDASHVSHKKKC